MPGMSDEIEDQLALAARIRQWRGRALLIGLLPGILVGCIAFILRPGVPSVVLGFSVYCVSASWIMLRVRGRGPKCTQCGESWAAMTSPHCRWRHCPGCGLKIRSGKDY